MKRFFSNAIARITPSCKEMSRLSSESLDRKLTIGERCCMWMHGWICGWCQDYSKQVSKVNDSVKDEGESLAELCKGNLSEDCKARMRTLINTSTQKDSTKD
jgi:hypothetical protein